MPDETFKVNIDIGLGPDAFQNPKKAADALGDVAGAADKASGAHRKLGEAVKEAGLPMREQRELVRGLMESLGQSLPGIGLLFNPETAGAVALFAAVEQVVDKLKEAKDRFLEAAAASDAFNASIEKNRRAFAESVTGANADYERSLQNISTAEQNLEQLSEDRIASIERESTALKALIGLREQLYGAQLDALEAEGKITPTDAARQKEQNALRAQDEDHGASQKAAADTLTGQRGEMVRQKKALGDADQPEALRNAHDYQSRGKAIAEMGALIDAQDKKIEEAKKKLNEAVADEAAAKGEAAGLANIPGVGAAYAARAKQKEEEANRAADLVGGLTGKRDEWQGGLDQLKKQQADADAHIKAVEESNKALEKSIADLAHTIDEGASKLKESEYNYQQQRQIRVGINQANDLARDIKAAPDDADAALRAQTGRQTGAAAALGARQALTDASLLEQHLRSHPGGASQDDLNQLHSLIQRMLGYMENVSLSNSASKGELSALESRLRTMEMRLNVNRAY